MGRSQANQARGGRTGAFTLIELLVVVAIIAVLISILLPALAKARVLAKGAVCLSNERQIGAATVAYTSENNGTYFYTTVSPPLKSDGTILYYKPNNPNFSWINDTWFYFLYKYIPDDNVLRCALHPNWPCGYAMNTEFGYYICLEPTNMNWNNGQGANVRSRKETQVDNPSRVIFATDSLLAYWSDLTCPSWKISFKTLDAPLAEGGYIFRIDAAYCGRSDLGPSLNNYNSFLYYYNYPAAAEHNGGLNSVFADGHAETLLFSTMMNNRTYWYVNSNTVPTRP